MTVDMSMVGAGRNGEPDATDRSIDGADVVVVRGAVERGDQRGRQIGFPTANIGIDDDSIADGVWAGWLERADGDRLAAAISIGRRATVYRHGVRLLEAHVLDFDGDLYDEVVRVLLVEQLRGQQRFASLDALVAQLRHDVARTRSFAGRSSTT
jgi:FAD synthase